MSPAQFSHIAPSLPDQPGIYKYFDVKGQLIYVGKAKHIRKRLSSYFTKQVVNQKTQELVKRIEKIEFTIVNSEADAFLLENSLIKEFRPRFNILLKDDKTYPFIVIRKEDFPRVFLTRYKIQDGSTYLGPFTSVYHVRELLNFIRQSIPLRTCTLDLSPKKIAQKKYKVCLEYHLGNCKGGCVGFEKEAQYDMYIKDIEHILKGNISQVINSLKAIMSDHAANLRFEEAQEVKSKIETIQRYKAKSTIVSPTIEKVDVITILQDVKTAYVNYLVINDGAIIHGYTFEVNKKLEETDEDIPQFQQQRILIPSKATIAPLRDFLIKAFNAGKITDKDDVQIYKDNSNFKAYVKTKDASQKEFILKNLRYLYKKYVFEPAKQEAGRKNVKKANTKEKTKSK